MADYLVLKFTPNVEMTTGPDAAATNWRILAEHRDLPATDDGADDALARSANEPGVYAVQRVDNAVREIVPNPEIRELDPKDFEKLRESTP